MGCLQRRRWAGAGRGPVAHRYPACPMRARQLGDCPCRSRPVGTWPILWALMGFRPRSGARIPPQS